MKILRSIHTLDPAVGGPIESVKQSSTELVRLGHEVNVVTLDAPADPWLRDLPFVVHALGPGRGSYGYTPNFVRWISERRTQYNAVIVHGIWQYSSFGVWRALRGTETPYFVFPHGMLDPWFRRTYPLKHIKKLLYWPWAEYRVLRDASAVLFTSEEERRLARQSFFPYSCREVVVNYGTAAPNVNLEAAHADFLSAFPDLRGKRLLLFLGRLHEKKGCNLLIQAFAEDQTDQSMHLVMAGPAANESYEKQLRELAGTAPITFTGMLSGNLKWGALSAADAFMLPSHQENFGISVVEALACGTPVLISNKVNIWKEIVGDGAGFADEDDREGTARLLQRWRQTSAASREAMSAKARHCFERRFQIEAATKSLVAVLEGNRRAP